MQETKGLLEQIKLHYKLAIRVSSNLNNNLPEAVMKMLAKPHRKANYFFVFIENGSLTHKVDLNDLTITNGQLFFVLPNQIHSVPKQKTEGMVYFKMSFDQNCLSLLPKQFSFLINPLSSQTISFDIDSKQRVKALFEILNKILHSEKEQKDAEIILAYLNSLLTELNNSYFKSVTKEKSEPNKLSKYIEFKIAVESHLTEQYSINTIAKNLSITTNNLYLIVKEFSGVSPKEFITNRLVLEAQRKLFYSETSVKELAYELGFSDPDYFSKLFKKNTGKSVTQFLESIQDLSSN
ncbi:MAG: AraC family transcriptional regulator [Bacteroidia bacterium]|nr:AraC family transcriptional regulator [Bacteroidia bacterium]MCF8426711.1 AraC family transcriptional regulator [Bacteroidia bacterium]MCF8445949.1 AraC family transcriptional regulator [Bacteroidia bacterium]